MVSDRKPEIKVFDFLASSCVLQNQRGRSTSVWGPQVANTIIFIVRDSMNTEM